MLHARALFSAAVLFAAVACNMVLDNRPGVLDESDETDVSPAYGGAAEEGGVPSGGASASTTPESGHDASDGEHPPTPPAPPDAGDATLPCPPGFGDCNGLLGDGCEADLSSTPTSCGACDVVCPVEGPPNTFGTCTSGVCVRSCAPGFADCNAKAQDGCEADLSKDKRNCGGCKLRCLFGRCENGVCVLGL